MDSPVNNPIKVQSVQEEYNIIHASTCPCGGQYQTRSQELIHDATSGQPYDYLRAECRQCGKDRVFIFDISSFFGKPAHEDNLHLDRDIRPGAQKKHGWRDRISDLFIMLAVITGICAFMMLLVDGFAVFLFFILITTLWTVLYFLIRPASRTQMVLPPQPTPSDDYSPGRMASVLEYLGLPLDSNSGGSEDALKGGMIKSSIYMVCETLHRREFDESKKLLDNLFESVDSSDEVNRRVCAVILYLKGLACEGGKDPDQAREMYKKSLEFDPEYSRAMEQQEYLSRQE